MKLFKTILMIMFVASLTAGVLGCKKEGTGERAGKAVDKTIDDAKDKLHEATE